LGAILFELMTSELPNRSGNLPPIPARFCDALKDIVRRMPAADASARPSMGEIRAFRAAGAVREAPAGAAGTQAPAAGTARLDDGELSAKGSILCQAMTSDCAAPRENGGFG
jgi:hypothetical protein